MLIKRLTPVLSILALLGLALATWWFAEQLQPAESPDVTKIRSDKPDYIIQKMTLTRLNLEGQARYTLQADELRHFPADDSTWLSKPWVVSRDPLKPRRDIRAEEAWTNSGAEQIELQRNVVVTDATTPPLSLQTPFLTLLPDEDIARTTAEVLIKQGDNVLQGEGMEMNQTTRVLELHARVRGTLAPRVTSGSR